MIQHCTPFNIALYSHANVVTSASEQNINSGDMALYKYIIFVIIIKGSSRKFSLKNLIVIL